MPVRRRGRRKGSAGSVAGGEVVRPEEAVVLLAKLREIGVVTAKLVADARRAVADEVHEIEQRLARLRDLVTVVGRRKPLKRAAGPRVRRSGRGQGRKRRAPLSAERRKTMELQGRYMALGHHIPKAEMKKFREMINAKGKEATVRAMQAYVESHGKKRTKKE